MHIGALDHIAINVLDVDRALVFYHEILDLPIERLEDFRAGKCGFPSVRVNDQTVVDLFPAKGGLNPPPHPLNHFCFTLREGDLAVLRQKLVEHEVEIVEEATPRWGARGWGASMKVLDPDGNIVELKAPPSSSALLRQAQDERAGGSG